MQLEKLLCEDAWESQAKVFVVLFDTKTLFSKVAGLATRSRFNHVSLSFNRDLDEMFSFDASVDGFRREFKASFQKGAEFVVYSVSVPEQALVAMKARVDEIVNNGAMRYSFVKMFKAAINRWTRKNVFSLTKDGVESMICSEFVQSVLAVGGIRIVKDSRIMTPADFVRRKSLRFEYKGKV